MSRTHRWSAAGATGAVAIALGGTLAGALVPAACARAADTREFWPEVAAYVKLDPRTRLYLDLPYAVSSESDTRAVDLSAFLDVSLKPILRPGLHEDDWARKRYLWARAGFVHLVQVRAGERSPDEERGVIALYGRVEAPAGLWLEGRARADLRWIGGDYSTRWRARAEVNREFAVLDHAVTPYFNVEWFYDTRYGGWSRVLYQLGPEVTVNSWFRFEVYLAHQEDRLPQVTDKNALGVTGKFYF